MGKRAVNLSLEASLIERAKALDLNLSQALEAKLREIIREAEARRWESENSEAIESFNRYVDQHGTIGDEYRRYD